ncbi:GumC family protein [Spongiimicrobium salis]|uniref:GumC family protein n=1 Tax=Spongiimicrobium salis TaxID=1667022 RepID=UPI00374CE824
MEKLDLKEIMSPYLKQWKWFVLSAIVAVIIGYVYIRYSIPKYAAKAKIQIVEDQNSGGGLDLFKDLDFFSDRTNKVENEIEIINSRSNFIEIAKELGLNTKVWVLGNIKNTEVYSNPPIKLNFIEADSTIDKANFDFYLTLSSPTTFGYAEEEDAPIKVYSYGKTIPSPIGDMVVTPNTAVFDRYKNKKVKVSIDPITAVAQDYRNRISIASTEDYSNVVNISLQDPIKEKARDIIDALIRVYNKNAIADKKRIADRTSDFINERIANISSNLSSVDQSAQDLRTDKGITDIQSETNINLNVGAANRQELANVRNQLNIAASMQSIVEEQNGFELLPSNLGLTDGTIASTTSQYNNLVLERNRLLESSTERSPIVVNLDQQLNSLKQTIQSSLNSTVNNLGLTANTLSRQQAIVNSKIYSAPGNQRALRDITRKQETTESLYLYLLQKREEAQIAVASTSPKSKIIDFAYVVSNIPVSPQRKVIYLASLILGILIPFGIIYMRILLDNKIHNMHSLEKIVHDVPVLGEIPRLSKKDKKSIVNEDRSVLGESLRMIRTNLDYLLKTNVSGKERRNVIFVTSSVPGEGKTFLSTNLSLILASGNKKILLVGADIRNPKLYTFFPNEQNAANAKPKRGNNVGITEYLYDDTLQTKDVINPVSVDHNVIDIIYSGRIPPNPAELLMSERLERLLEEVSGMYDYVIVDTAPLMVVTDTLTIGKYADHMIYVTRAGITEKKAAEFPIKLQKEGKISPLSFVVNDVKASNLGYGGKYGYGYGKVQKKWWKF